MPHDIGDLVEDASVWRSARPATTPAGVHSCGGDRRTPAAPPADRVSVAVHSHPRRRRARRPRSDALRLQRASACSVRPTAPSCEEATSSSARPGAGSARSAARCSLSGENGPPNVSITQRQVFGPTAAPPRAVRPTTPRPLLPRGERRGDGCPRNAAPAAARWLPGHSRCTPCAVGRPGLDRLPVRVLRVSREPEQRERGFAGVGIGAEDDEIGHERSSVEPLAA